MKSAEYWQKRAEAVEAVAWKRADTFLKDLDRISKDTENEIRKDIESWYVRFAKNNQISLQEARKLLKEGDLEEFKWTADKYIKEAKKANLTPDYVKKLENASAKFHISRLEAIETEMQQKVELLYKQQTDGMTEVLSETLSDSYLRNAYEIQKGIGIGFNVAALSESKIKTLLSRPWTADGLTFKDRCWAEKENMIEDLQKILLQGMIKGDSSQTLTEQVKKRFRVSRYQAGRLVHTETTYFNAKAAQESYKDLGVEQIEIIETLDSLTCELCGSMDGKVIPISAFEAGVTAPPFHPNCRGTTAPYIEDDDFGERIARDEDGQTYNVPGNMTYEEWKKQNAKMAEKESGTGFSDLPSSEKSSIIKEKEQAEIISAKKQAQADLENFDITENGKYKVLKFENASDYEEYIKSEYLAQGITDEEHAILWGIVNGYIRNSESFKINGYLRGTIKDISSGTKTTIETLTRLTENNALQKDYIGYRRVKAYYLYDVLGINTSDKKYLQGFNVGSKVSRDEAVKAINQMVLDGGKPILDKAFSSISLSEELNAFKYNPIEFEIQMPVGTKGLITDNYPESEFISKRDSSIEIFGAIGVDKGYGEYHIKIFGRLVQD